MTHRVLHFVLFALFVSALVLLPIPLVAQDSSNPVITKSSPAKSKKAVPAANDKSAKYEDKATSTSNSDNAERAKPEKAKKEDAPPPPPSPKLIEIPQDDATYTPRPKVVAVFIFTNGNRIESDDYLITKDALFINKDGQKTRYPINTVDRDATKTANQSRGVDIVFPKSKSEFNLDF